jgi:hypothetical protein
MTKITKEYATMLRCVRREVADPESKFNGSDWQAACNDFVQDYPNMPNDEVMSLFYAVCEDHNIVDI